MKLSEMYWKLQMILIQAENLTMTDREKLAMLRELMKQEDLASFKEEHEGLEALE